MERGGNQTTVEGLLYLDVMTFILVGQDGHDDGISQVL
jgi:hypothetical protein